MLRLMIIQEIEEAMEQRDAYRAVLERIADPRKRDHSEPDAYTQLGCVMNMADEVLKQFPKESV